MSFPTPIASNVETFHVETFDAAPTIITSITIPQKTKKPPFFINKSALYRKEKKYLPDQLVCFDVPVEKIFWALPEGVEQPTAIFTRCPIHTVKHVEGGLDASILTLLKGKKEWRIYSPDRKSIYITTHYPGETVYVPPGYPHEVLTTSTRSIAYGALWASSEQERSFFLFLCFWFF